MKIRVILCLGFGIIIGTQHLIAQGANVLSAWENIQQYKREIEYNEEVAIRSLLKARDFINEAIVNPTTSGTSKAWKRRGDVYYHIYKDKSPRLMLERKHAEDTAAASYLRALTVELDGKGRPKIEAEDEILARLGELANTKIEAANLAVDNKNFAMAIQHYQSAILWLQGLADVAKKPEKLLGNIAGMIGQQGVFATKLEDYSGALMYFNKVMEMGKAEMWLYQYAMIAHFKVYEKEPTSSNEVNLKATLDKAMSLYSDSIEIYELNLKYVLMKGSDAEILNQIELAKEKFPKNKVNFLTLEVNFYLERGDDVKALKALRQTIDNMQSDDPLLSELYFNSGLLLFTIAQDTKDEKNKAVLFSESKEMFTKVIEIDSKYAAAYVSLANFDLVEANALVKKANDLPLSKQKEFDLLQKASYASFNKAAEYLEKAYEIQASESTRETLILIYTKVGNLSRVSELKK